MGRKESVLKNNSENNEGNIICQWSEKERKCPVWKLKQDKAKTKLNEIKR